MSNVKGWYYYKHAILPDTAPDVDVDISLIESGEIWNLIGSEAIVSRWTTDFDCGYETEWWYVIKDNVFDIAALNSKKRYKINRGKKYFDVRLIDPSNYKREIYDIQVDAYNSYPAKYRPKVDEQKVFSMVEGEWNNPTVKVYMAFHRETGVAAGYIQLAETGKCIESVAQKARPEFEKFQVNYAMLSAVLEDFRGALSEGSYICVGARNIQHETAFQDFVEDIFGFRKAYCKLNLAYNPKIKWLIGLIYPFRGLLKKFDNIGIVHKVNGVLAMEEIVRKQKKADKKDAK